MNEAGMTTQRAAARSASLPVRWVAMTTPERLIFGYFATLPLLWLLGLMLPVAVAAVFGVLLGFARSRRGLLAGFPWLLVALAQTISVLFNMIEQSEPLLMLAKHMLSAYVLGWYVLWASVTIGACGLIRTQVIIQASAKVGLYYFLLALVAYPIALISNAPYLFVLSPVGHLLPPDMPSTTFSFGIFVYIWEDLFGVLMPRLSLFFPWSTVAGYAGIFLVFIVANHVVRRQARFSIFTGLFMLAASMSRLAWIAFVVCSGFRWMLSRGQLAQYFIASLGLAVALLVIITARIPETALGGLSDAFDSARPGASQARKFVYAATRKAIGESPVLGHGWPGGPVISATNDQIFGGGTSSLVIGSHSTVSGLIYKGGWLTFGLFVCAMLWSAALLIVPRAPSAIAHSALTVLLAIAIMCDGEGLESIVVPTLFAFIWLGNALALPRRAATSPLR